PSGRSDPGAPDETFTRVDLRFRARARENLAGSTEALRGQAEDRRLADGAAAAEAGAEGTQHLRAPHLLGRSRSNERAPTGRKGPERGARGRPGPHGRRVTECPLLLGRRHRLPEEADGEGARQGQGLRTRADRGRRLLGPPA